MIKILFLAANPIDKDPLRLGEEARTIDETLRQAEFRDQFEIEQAWAVRVRDIQSHLLRHRPQIVHFSGHGEKTSEIILENESGQSQPVTARALSRLFSVLKEDVRCVVLNACYSRVQAQAIAEHIDCVIGMSAAVGDQTAIRFSAAFYEALAFGKNVQTAFDLGCNLIDLTGLDEQDIPRLIRKKDGSCEQPLVEQKQQSEKPAPRPVRYMTMLSIASLALAGVFWYVLATPAETDYPTIPEDKIAEQPRDSTNEENKDTIDDTEEGAINGSENTQHPDLENRGSIESTDSLITNIDQKEPETQPEPTKNNYDIFIDAGLQFEGANVYLDSVLIGSVPGTFSIDEGDYILKLVYDNKAYGYRWECSRKLLINESNSVHITNDECIRMSL